jgi:signal transduction histidine kinase
MPVDEARRLAMLQGLDILDTGPEDSFNAVVACAAQLTGCSGAAVSLIDARRQWVKASHGMPFSELPRARSFCARTILQDDLLEVRDASQDARFEAHPHVTSASAIRLYAGLPLKVNGLSVGTLSVIDTEPRELSPSQRQGLHQLAQVASQLLSGRARGVALDDERRRLLDFARASGDWMWETDAELRYTWVSGAFEAVTGVPPSNIYGQQIADAPLLDALGQALGSGRTFHSLLRQRQHITRVVTDKMTPRGALQISRSAVPVFDGAGRFAGYRGTARDVTAHIAAERRTHAQARLLAKLSSQVPGVIFQFRHFADNTIHSLYASDACREMFGLEPPSEGHVGDPTAVCRAIHPEDQPSAQQSLIDAARSLSPWHREFRLLHPERAERWLEVRAMPEAHPNGGVVWHGFAADVTARKETELALRRSEQRWNMAAAGAGIGIAHLDVGTGLMTLDAIAAANHGLGYPIAPFPVDQWFATIVDSDQDATRAVIAKAMATRSMIETRARVMRPDGSRPTLEILAHCTYNSAGDVNGILGTCRDVTHQEVHEQLRRDKESAERASRAKTEFLSRVSHELRTPLNGILGFAQLMALDRAQPLANEQARRLDSVLHAGRHLLALIDDVLNLARIEQEDFALQQSPVDLMASTTLCMGLIRPMADDAGVRLVAPATGPIWSKADARAVEQVIINLLSNAIKYNRPDGEVVVSITGDALQVQLTVTDQGDGLSEEQQTQLFQPFNRLGAEQRRVEGTGLGLVIARALASAMGGRLTVRSQVGVGSSFSLSLPVGSPATPIAPAPLAADAPLVAASRSRKRVLYIEDEPLNQLLMQELFKARPQWELDVAPDGTLGLARIASESFDLVLIDMNLPDMSGLTLIKALRSDAHTAPLHCIALSADAMQSQIEAAMAAGYNAYWTKPIHVARVLEDLEKVLG